MADSAAACKGMTGIVVEPTRSGQWRLRHNTVRPAVHPGVFGPLRFDLACARAAWAAGSAGRHLQPPPARDSLVVGGWDPFNVTEDADLGFRLARRGWQTAVLQSTTWEEAPVTFSRWFRQRTRWLKGWMQTYLVHTRQPWRLSAELGPRGALGFHVLMGGLVLLALMHPAFYAVLVYHAATGQLLAPAATPVGAVFWAAAWVNLAAGYLTSMVVGAASVWRRGQPGLMRSALSMPLCWLLVSAAAYRALCQLATDPYLWEKTEHGDG